MAEVFNPVIEVRTGDSEQTVKGLKKEISDLRDSILNLEKGTEAYEDAVSKLQADQRKLNEVMALTKKEATALEGSYDALVHQMAQLKKEWRATNDEAKRNELGKQIDAINSQLKELDASIGNHQRNVGNYTESIIDAFESLSQEIAHYEDSLYKLEKGTAEYTETFDKLAQAKKRQREFDMEVDAASMDLATAFDTAAQAGAALASGFGAIQGVMALCGKDTEKLTEQMAKLQAVMAVVQGAQGIGAFAKSIKSLGIAIKTITGLSMGWIAVIAAVVTAIGTLIANLPMVKEREAAWEAQIRSTIEAQEQLKASVEKSNETLSDRIELLKAQGVEERKLIEIQLEQAKTNKKIAWDNLMKAQNKYIFDVKSDAQGAMEMTNGAFKQKYGMNKEDALAHYKKLMDEATDFYHQQEDIYNGLLHQLEVFDAQSKTAFANRIGDMEEALKSEEQRLKEQYEKDLEMAEKYGFGTEIITKKYQADLKALREKAKTEIKTVEELLAEAQKEMDAVLEEDLANLDEDIVIDEPKNTKTYTQADKARATIGAKEISKRGELNKTYLIEDEEERERAIYEINLKYAEQKKQLLSEALKDTTIEAEERGKIMLEIANLEVDIEEQKYAELDRQRKKDLEKRKSTTESIIAVTQAGLDATSQILNKVAEGYESDGEVTEEEAKKLKAIRYSTTVIDMLQGMLTAFSGAMSLGPIAGPIVGGINAAAVAAVGAMSLAEIKKQDFSTMNNAPIATTSVNPSASAYSSAPFDAVRNITGAQETEQLNQATKVYVLESDISNAMNKAQIRESEASF